MEKKVDKIAIVSISGVFPGASNLDKFLTNIKNKNDAIIEIPEKRWVLDKKDVVDKKVSPDHALSSKAGLITDFSFDPEGYKIDKDLLRDLDFTHKFVLHAAREAMENCHTNDEILKRSGVIIACISLPAENSSKLSYDIFFEGKDEKLSCYKSLGASILSFPAALIAKSFGLMGGCLTLDAACASSLYSIKLACDELLLNNADMMIAGGVSSPCSLYTQIGFSQLQALSPTGRCSPFDSRADGLVVGEGAGIIVLKRLKDALDCKDKIYGIIQGTGLANDIEGSLVAPASEGQIRALTQAFLSAGWPLDNVQYIECHGSATPVGDNTELNSMINLQQNLDAAGLVLNNKKEFSCAIGSVKSMTGHLLTAAGAAGMIKTLLAMNNKFLPPSLNFISPPDNSPLYDSCFKVQTSVSEWKKNSPGESRKFGVSGFGFGGINAHILVEEYNGQAGKSFYMPGRTFLSSPEIALVGMGAITGCTENIEKLNDFFIKGACPAPENKEYFIHNLPVSDYEFHIPPNQINDILPNQLLMLKCAKMALLDADIQTRPDGERDEKRVRFGAAIGIEFDYKATDFYLRWKKKAEQASDFDTVSEPLTATRTLGALGGIVASRIAREFRLGGPCFTVSSGNCSGLKAVDIGVKSLMAGETDIFLCGAVDMASDKRQIAVNNSLLPCDSNLSEIMPSEGACAVVLKTLDKAIKDNNRIYAVITGTGHASSGEFLYERGKTFKKTKDSYKLSLDRCLKNSNTKLSDIIHFEINSTFLNRKQGIENQALSEYFKKNLLMDSSLKLESARSVTGDTRGASGLVSMVKSAILLNNRSKKDIDMQGIKQNRICVSSIADDGGCTHIMLMEHHCRNKKIENIVNNNSFQDLPYDPDFIIKSTSDTLKAHDKFLELTRNNIKALKEQFSALTRLAPFISTGMEAGKALTIEETPAFTREQCLEFAVGKASNVLGDAFRVVDTYPVRVRLPAEPLMLVDRIIKIKGEMLSMGSGEIITQHDVKEDAWYLDGGCAPVSISIEAGQADLFLSSYLGIDHRVKGKRSYRLLDAKVTFHRSLPKPGETIEYHIEIDRFLKQGKVYLFFFHYKGYINNQILLSMRDGCAGFFNKEEVKKSGGIIITQKDKIKKKNRHLFKFPLKFSKESLNDDKVEALRHSDLYRAFGKEFENIKLGRCMRLPGERMHLIDRVLEIDPEGGRFAMGSITAEADINKDDWFLTCHFIDDMVMPGTLMYECCSHALRIFTMRMGWVTEKNDVFYDIIEGIESDLKCRGPVTVNTKKAGYFIEIKQMGYDPEPFVIADAHMYSDDLQIVFYKNMGLKIRGINEKDINRLWR